jgi:mannose-1-phosphate guanylyltransferase
MKIVIRAGGTGTRLWPMSRQSNPKQFQAIVGEQLMIKMTYDRVLPAVLDARDIFVTINQSMLGVLKESLSEILESNIVTETESRNTGPAMCLEVCFLSAVCDANEVIASVPSDDFISDSEAFGKLLKLSEQFLQNHPDYILTPAVRPAYLDTGYSYFRAGENLASEGEEKIFKVA